MTDTYTLQMLDASRAAVPVGTAELAAAVDACLTCVQACTTCADSDLIEPDVATLRACVAINLVCADICDATARVLSRPGQWDLITVRDQLVGVCPVMHGVCRRVRSARRAPPPLRDLRRGVSCLLAGLHGPARRRCLSGSRNPRGGVNARSRSTDGPSLHDGSP